MNKNNKKKNGFRIGRIYDLLILPIYIILSVMTLYKLKNYTDKYFYIAAIILGLILLIFLLTLLYNKRSIEIIRRLILTVLCVFLFIGYGKLDAVDNFFDDITQGDEDQYTKTQMNLLALQSSDVYTATIDKFEDISDKKVGINTSSDKKASNYVKKKMDASLENVQYLEYSDYGQMIQDLYYGYIDVACFNVAQTETIESTWGSLDGFTNNIRSFTYKEKVQISQNEKDVSKETFTVLISANDEIGVPANNSLSDMNMLVMINPVTHQIITSSIPRDSYVGNPTYNYASDKLTHTGNDGAENTKKAVAEALGVDVDFYVKVSFSSVIKIIDELGSIDVNVPIAFCEQDENRSFADEDLICLNAGEQSLNGKQALAFSRHRHSYANQDLGRNEAQMQVIKGIIKKLMTKDGIGKIDKILNIASQYVLTNFTNAQIQSFVKSQIDDIQPWSMSSLSLSGGVTDENIETASAPGEGLSVYYLKKQEVKALQAAYKMFTDSKQLKDFHFEIDELYQDLYDFKEGENTVYYDPSLYF